MPGSMPTSIGIPAIQYSMTQAVAGIGRCRAPPIVTAIQPSAEAHGHRLPVTIGTHALDVAGFDDDR